MSKYDVGKFKQVTVTLNTPSQPDGSVDLKAVRAVVNYFYNKGIQQMYTCGSMGEGSLLDTRERTAVTETVLEEAAGRMNIIVRVGRPDTGHSEELARHAEKVGANVTSAAPCVYYRMGEESVFQHQARVAGAADLPFFIYNTLQLTGFNLSMDLLRRMLESEKIAGIRCSSDPVQDILRSKLTDGKGFLVFNGSGEQLIAGRLMGADAGIGGTHGTMPELHLKMGDLANRGEWEKAQMVQNLVTPLIYRLCSFASIYGVVKGVISLDGCPVGDPRLPFLPVVLGDPQLAALYHDIRQAVKDTKDLQIQEAR